MDEGSIEACLAQLEEYLCGSDGSQLVDKLTSYPAISIYLKANLSLLSAQHTSRETEYISISAEKVRGDDVINGDADRHVAVYQCGVCPYGSFTLAELTYHKRIHDDNNHRTCHICEHTACNKQALNKHLKSHQDLGGRFKCMICSYVCLSETLISEHTRLVHSQYEFTCGQCGFSCNDEELYARHSVAIHPPSSTRSRKKQLKNQAKNCDMKKSRVVRSYIDKTDSVLTEEGYTDRVEEHRDNINTEHEYESHHTSREATAAAASDEDNRTPWWDTANELNPPNKPDTIISSLLSRGSESKQHLSESEAKVTTGKHCQYCGRYITDVNRHQCEVVRPRRQLMCSMCDYKSYSKEELSRHGIEVHMRHWTSLQVVMTREIIADREQVCQLVNSYIPNRYKGTADSIYVKYRTAERRDGGGGGQAEICLYRCTKCYQCYLSIDLLAGHKLLDQCVPQPIQLCCVICGITLNSRDEYSTHHLQCHTTIEPLPNSSHNTSDSSAHHQHIQPGYTEDTLLMLRSGPTSIDSSHTNTDTQGAAPSWIKARIIEGAYELRCHICQHKATSTDKYMEHVCSEHTTVLDTVDVNISASSMSAAAAADSTQCIMTSVYGCSYCDFISDDKDKLCNHMLNHPTINRKLRSNNKADPVTKVNHTDNVEDICSTAAADLSNTDMSKEATSGIAVDIPCPTCGVSTDLSTTDRAAAEGGAEGGGGGLVCHSCGLSTDISSTTTHTSHNKPNDKPEQPFTCTECDFSTKYSSTLTIHMRQHTGYRPYVCSMCGKAFITNSELRKHERRHTGSTPRNHTCEICGKTYTTLQHLKVHLRRHSGDRPFKCTMCSFAATSKSVLVNHMPTHTGEKNYQCHLCDFVCASSGTLSNHRRLKHKIVNKRKTLAETTPESILAAAEVAGKSRRRVKPNTDSNLNSASLQSSISQTRSGGVQQLIPVVDMMLAAAENGTTQVISAADYVIH